MGIEITFEQLNETVFLIMFLFQSPVIFHLDLNDQDHGVYWQRGADLILFIKAEDQSNW